MNDWKEQLKNAISSIAQLYDYVGLPPEGLPEDAGFAVRVPKPFADKIQKNNRKDPLLLQVMPRAQEQKIVDGFVHDPLGETQANVLPGLLHKYHGRVLIVLTGSCAINCRYCFRRHFAYTDNNALKQWPQIISYIKQDVSISEVILSGGDPLLISDERLEDIFSDLGKIKQLTTIRLHTRLPVVIPERITERFVSLLKTTRLNVVMVLHVNHANEIDTTLSHQLQKLRGVAQLLNQAVLLKDINDSLDALIALSHKLFAAGVLPYYLHQLDPVTSTHHFYVDQTKGLALLAQLRARLPGYLVPRYALEVAGALSKAILD